MKSKGKQKPLIYLASPYSHKHKHVRAYREDYVCAMAAYLILKGHHIYCPIAETVSVEKHGKFTSAWAFWRDIDLHKLEKCDELWIAGVDGWEKSSGVQGELKFALNRQYKISLVWFKSIEYDVIIKRTLSNDSILKRLKLAGVHELGD